MNKKQFVIDTIMKQTQPFYSTTITSLSGSSVALVNNTLNELIAAGMIQSRKEGKKLCYTLIDAGNNQKMEITTSPICNMSEKFGFIRNIVQMVINGVNPSALIVGRAGVGKTYLVRDELNKAGLVKDQDYLFVSGHSSAFGLYKLLHDNRDSFIIFDDCDSIFKDMKAINVLKSALDSYDIRRVSWISDRTENNEDIEPYFDFTGRIIFISNLYADRIDNAIKSRSFCMNLHMTNSEVTEHMHNLIDVIEPSIPTQLKSEVLDFLDSISSNLESYSIRTLIQAIRIRVGSGVGVDWKKMIQVITCNSF